MQSSLFVDDQGPYFFEAYKNQDGLNKAQSKKYLESESGKKASITSQDKMLRNFTQDSKMMVF